MSRSATAILAEIRNGELVVEMSEALSDALQSVMEVGKDATVTVKITISQLTKVKLTEPAIGYKAEVVTKLAKADVPDTIFFLDANGDPTRSPARQTGLDLHVAATNKGA